MGTMKGVTRFLIIFKRIERHIDDTVCHDEDFEDHSWRTIDLLTVMGNVLALLSP